MTPGWDRRFTMETPVFDERAGENRVGVSASFDLFMLRRDARDGVENSLERGQR